MKNFLKRTGFIGDFIRFKRLSCNREGKRFALRWKDRHPCLHDCTGKTSFDRHYVFHPAWACRILAATAPSLHIDISSTLHFATMVSAFIPVRFYDYRPADIAMDNLTADSVDLTALPFADGSIRSLSCMHVVEHIGLGRYGDPLDPGGDLKAIAELKRVLAPGGSLLFVVPVGKARVMFNAHRIYAYEQVVGYFNDLHLEEFALIPDQAKDGGLVRNATQGFADAQRYGCGCFWFTRKV